MQKCKDASPTNPGTLSYLECILIVQGPVVVELSLQCVAFVFSPLILMSSCLSSFGYFCCGKSIRTSQ